jgi:hypothetical protein
MTTVIADLRNFYGRVCSEITGLKAKNIVASANVGTKDYYIHKGIEVSISNPKASGIVIQAFVVEITPTEEGFIATSRISNVYELEATPGQALKSYLKSLVDELVWLQCHKEELLPSILEELYLLQSYVRVVE